MVTVMVMVMVIVVRLSLNPNHLSSHLVMELLWNLQPFPVGDLFLAQVAASDVAQRT
jgi:hypothetical protein